MAEEKNVSFTEKKSKKSKSDIAMSAILKYIKTNNLQMGDRLPSEREMSEMFLVGRPAIREAIKVL